MPHALLTQKYEKLVKSGQIERDPAQLSLVAKFDILLAQLETHRLQRKSSALGWLMSVGQRNDPPPRGVYIHGSVGRGKTMLMDLFFAAADVRRKRRVHFHAFMAEAHARIHAWRQLKKRGEAKGDDPIAPVAADLAAEAWLLCFDEFAVTDIGDAMVLGRLFQALFAEGVVIVATSNVAPHDLYRDGLNRALFLPFIALIESRMEIVELAARTDFRLEKLGGAPVYLTPPDARARAELDRIFLALTGAARGSEMTLPVLGRKVQVPEALGGVARFSFADLCEKPLGSADFLAIAQHFHTLVIDGVKVIGEGRRNEARRFINLIDTLYDNHVKLIVSAEAEPDKLYAGGAGPEAFEFARIVSRLIEMRSADYLGAAHGIAASRMSGNSTGLVET